MTLRTRPSVDFIINEGDATHEAIADDTASDLAKVGLTVNALRAVF